MVFFDTFGNPIELGDCLVYPRRLPSGKLGLGSLTVHAILADRISGHNITGRKLTLRQVTIDRSALVRGLDEPKRRRPVRFR